MGKIYGTFILLFDNEVVGLLISSKSFFFPLIRDDLELFREWLERKTS